MRAFLLKVNRAAVLFVLAGFTGLSNGQSTTALWDGAYTAEQAQRGEQVYTSACIACHGQDLGGNSNAPGLVGMGFMFLWEGRTLGTFYEKIRAEMPTDRPGRLPQQDYLDVVAYILQANAFPAGDRELPTAAESLAEILISPRP